MNNCKSVQVTADALAQLKARQKWTVYAWGGGLPSIAAAWAEMDAAAGHLPARVRVDGPKWILDGTPIEENALNHAPYPGRPDWHGRSNRNTLAQGAQLGVVVTQNPTHFLHPLPNGAPPRPVETMSMVRSLLK